MKTPQSAIEIRKAVHADIPSIQDIAEVTWPVAYGTIITPKQIRYMLDNRYNNDVIEKEMFLGDTYLMAEMEGIAIGYACVKARENGVYKLDKLYVNPAKQKTGAGKALLQAVIKLIIDSRGRELILQVNRKNPAVGFYTKMGFVIAREEDFSIGNGYYMKDYVMSLLLNN